jgi:hypothetical protein
MAAHNLVSATIAPEAMAQILDEVADIGNKLDFLIAFGPDEIQRIVKVGNNFAPFLDKAYAVAERYPEILPRMFDHEEFARDYQLARDLHALAGQLEALSLGVQNTLSVARADAMVAALEVYACVKNQADRVPGLGVVADDLATFFKRPRNPKPKVQG